MCGTVLTLVRKKTKEMKKDEDVLEDIDFDELDDHLEQFQQDDFIKEALAKGVDLRQYAQQIDRELREVEMESITQYVAKSADIVDLYNQVQSCDDILARMQEMLLGFQADSAHESVF